MQLGTRCSDGSCEAAEDLISGFSAIEAEAELVQIGLKLCAAAVISAEQECFQVADGFVQPVQVARFILFRVQLHARQVLIASVAVAFDFCTCRNSFADDLLKCFARDVIRVNSAVPFSVFDSATTIFALSVPRPRLPLCVAPPT